MLRMSLHQAHNLLNNGVAEMAIPNAHFSQPAPCAVSMFSFFNVVHSGVCFVTMMIMAYSFEKILAENAKFRINNVNNCVFTTANWCSPNTITVMELCIFFEILKNVHAFLHFGIILRYMWFHKILMKYCGMMFQDFFRESE